MDGKIKINKNGYEINGDLESEQILLAEKLSKLSFHLERCYFFLKSKIKNKKESSHYF